MKRFTLDESQVLLTRPATCSLANEVGLRDLFVPPPEVSVVILARFTVAAAVPARISLASVASQLSRIGVGVVKILVLELRRGLLEFSEEGFDVDLGCLGNLLGLNVALECWVGSAVPQALRVALLRELFIFLFLLDLASIQLARLQVLNFLQRERLSQRWQVSLSLRNCLVQDLNFCVGQLHGDRIRKVSVRAFRSLCAR